MGRKKLKSVEDVKALKRGDAVAWETQSGGFWKEKHGTVIGQLPAGVPAFEVDAEVSRSPGARKKFQDVPGKVDRVLVAVPRKQRRHATCCQNPPSVDYYAPTHGQLAQHGRLVR